VKIVTYITATALADGLYQRLGGQKMDHRRMLEGGVRRGWRLQVSGMAVRVHRVASSAMRAPFLVGPLLLVCSTFGTIISLAAVWISTAVAFTPMVGA
jgi:hypothetical protein